MLRWETIRESQLMIREQRLAAERRLNPTLLCLTGFLGSGKSTVKDMFTEYNDVETCSDIDKMSTFKPTQKLLVFDSIKTPDELTYLKWLAKYPNVLVITVECPREQRIQRVKERDKCSDIEFHIKDKNNRFGILDLQALSKYVVHNGRSLDETKGQVYYIHSLLTKDSNLLMRSQNSR